MARKHVNDAGQNPAGQNPAGQNPAGQNLTGRGLERQPSRGASKRDLPQKTCVSCGRPFVWRRKWARDWDQVKFCSDRCRTTGAGPGEGAGAAEGVSPSGSSAREPQR